MEASYCVAYGVASRQKWPNRTSMLNNRPPLRFSGVGSKGLEGFVVATEEVAERRTDIERKSRG